MITIVLCRCRQCGHEDEYDIKDIDESGYPLCEECGTPMEIVG